MSVPPLTDTELAHLEAAIIDHCLPLTSPFREAVYRFASVRRANADDLLSGAGSRIHGHRWNPRGVAAAYTSLEPIVALVESFEAYRAGGLPLSQAPPLVLASIEIDLPRVLDLTGPDAGSALVDAGFPFDEVMAEDWRRRMESGGVERGRSIEIGRIAHSHGVQGLIVPSRPHPTGKNLVIFPDNCPPASLRIVNRELLPLSP